MITIEVKKGLPGATQKTRIFNAGYGTSISWYEIEVQEGTEEWKKALLSQPNIWLEGITIKELLLPSWECIFQYIPNSLHDSPKWHCHSAMGSSDCMTIKKEGKILHVGGMHSFYEGGKRTKSLLDLALERATPDKPNTPYIHLIEESYGTAVKLGHQECSVYKGENISQIWSEDLGEIEDSFSYKNGIEWQIRKEGFVFVSNPSKAAWVELYEDDGTSSDSQFFFYFPNKGKWIPFGKRKIKMLCKEYRVNFPGQLVSGEGI